MTLLEVDANAVQPGWAALVVVLLLAGAMVLLYLSMRKQFRKIRIPDDAADNAADTAADSPPERQPGAPG
jgi:hypothetical protein